MNTTETIIHQKIEQEIGIYNEVRQAFINAINFVRNPKFMEAIRTNYMPKVKKLDLMKPSDEEIKRVEAQKNRANE